MASTPLVNEAADVCVNVLTIGGTGLSAFAGGGGGYTAGVLNCGATGLSLTGVEFGLALMSDTTTPTRKWTTLQATAATAGFVGLGEDLVVSATGVKVAINQANAAVTNNAVVDYSLDASTADNTTDRKTELSVATGTGTSLALDLDGTKGELLQASGNLNVNVLPIAN